MDIEVRTKVARVLGECECMLLVYVCVCVYKRVHMCVDSFSTSLKSAPPSSLLPLPHWSCLAHSPFMTPPSYLMDPYPSCQTSIPSITPQFLLPCPHLSFHHTLIPPATHPSFHFSIPCALPTSAYLTEDSSHLEERTAESEHIITTLVSNLELQPSMDNVQRVVCSSSDEELQLQMAEVRRGGEEFRGVWVWQEAMSTFIRTYV